ncbi:MAG TPA: hypothetical protein VJR48_03720 [Ktedonobacterales bacterium]|nr:hypothetical protein [Ktedonobacterales bacterium]
MREPHSIVSRGLSQSDYLGASPEDAVPYGPVRRVARAAAEGLLPGVILVALVALFWELSVIGRLFAMPYGIDMIQRTEMATAGGGLAIVVIVYLVSAVRTLQGVRLHQRMGEQVEAWITMTFLIGSLVVTLIPIFLALGFHQQPAP